MTSSEGKAVENYEVEERGDGVYMVNLNFLRNHSYLKIFNVLCMVASEGDFHPSEG
jgi:hypothetical protein